MKNKYRIVADNFRGYKVQIKYWWLPFFWFQKDDVDGINTFRYEKDAKEWIDKGCPKRRAKVIWESP